MLIRHTIIYTLGRSASGAINLIALAVFTRLLLPAEYGHYALVVVWVGVVNAIAFQWLHSGARRFLSAYTDRRGGFFATLRVAYARVAVTVVLLGTVVALGWPDPTVRRLAVLGTILLCAQAWLDLNLNLSLAGLKPIRYGTLNLIRSAVGLLCGGALAYFGLGATGVIIGIIAGYVVPGVIVALRDWRGGARGPADSVVMQEVLRYGLPLTAVYALSFVVTFSDRVLLAWLKGSGDVGTYAAAYDLTFQGLMTLMVMVNLSAFPLAVRALEEGGLDAARAQLTQHATLLLAVAMPATVGLALLAPNVARVFLGGAYQASGARLIPWLAFGTFVVGLKTYYFDLSFQLGRATTKQVWISAFAAAVNVGLNLWWIPKFGVLGAAWASLAAFLVAGVSSVLLGRRVLPMPLPWVQWVKIAVAGAIMGMLLLPVIAYRGAFALVGQVALGASVYGFVAILLNVGESRTALVQLLHKDARG